MSQAHVTMTLRDAGQGVRVIDVSGDFTASSETALMDVYAQAAAAGARAILLNFGNLDFMNSGGIGLLVTLLIRMNRQGQRLLAFALSEHYRHIFHITRLDEAIGIYGTEVEALSAVGA